MAREKPYYRETINIIRMKVGADKVMLGVTDIMKYLKCRYEKALEYLDETGQVTIFRFASMLLSGGRYEKPNFTDVVQIMQEYFKDKVLLGINDVRKYLKCRYDTASQYFGGKAKITIFQLAAQLL